MEEEAGEGKEGNRREEEDREREIRVEGRVMSGEREHLSWESEGNDILK